MNRFHSALTVGTIIAAAGHCFAASSNWILKDTGERTGTTDTIEIRGLSAGDFSPEDWNSRSPDLVPDIRHPLLEPRPGAMRNIYAPSAVAMPGGGWNIYYGGWDGIAEGHDHIYVTSTTDFLNFGPRSTVIQPGKFDHICNVNAQLDPARGGLPTLMCTVYPDENGRNKPALFALDQAAPIEPATATAADIVTVTGYENYPNADINGMNVLLNDGDRRLMYFGDFKNFGSVYVAESPTTASVSAEPSDATSATFKLVGPALTGSLAVNDVKKLQAVDSTGKPSGKPWYLMGLHMNRGQLYYSMSRDPLHFPPAQLLGESSGDADKYMVAIGFVTDLDSGDGASRVLGVLYGAGASPALASNRIFARWFQKQVEFDGRDAGQNPVLVGALGPDRQTYTVSNPTWTGSIHLNSEQEKRPTLLPAISLSAGHIYEIKRSMP